MRGAGGSGVKLDADISRGKIFFPPKSRCGRKDEIYRCLVGGGEKDKDAGGVKASIIECEKTRDDSPKCQLSDRRAAQDHRVSLAAEQKSARFGLSIAGSKRRGW